MGDNSKIQWTEKTWNPWHGCKKVSDGCKFCYMYRDKTTYGQDPTKVVRSKTTFNAPLKWHDPAFVFTCSWSDWFIDEADDWRDDAWKIIKETPHLTYQILTKRPVNIFSRLPKDWGDGYENVWLGVSAENQAMYCERWDILATVPAQVRFISFEPLLGFIDANFRAEIIKPDWIILGGESGNDNGHYKYRYCNLSWLKRLASEGKCFNIPTFVKQLGTYLAKEMDLKDRHGGDISEFPLDLQIREMPQTK